MYRSFWTLAGVAGLVAGASAACSGGIPGSGGSGGTTGHPTGAGAATSVTTSPTGGAAGGTTSSSTAPCTHAPDEDGDGDGWTGAEGDCNDCDPAINPGAIEVGSTGVDEDCNGVIDDVAPPCDGNLVLGDTSPMDGARAVDLCQQAAPADRRWGVLGAKYVSANGDDPRTPGLQVGLLDGFGPNVHVQSGARMLALSTGHARLPAQPGACGSKSCSAVANVDPPIGFPQVVPGCDGGTLINDDIALELKIRAPTNATGYSFLFKFASFEYPEWICTPYNDQFIALVSPAPPGSVKGNISFDSNKVPVSVNLGFFSTCDPASADVYAANCGAPIDPACPSPPSSYCPAGSAELEGTGFDEWGDAGATSWLKSQAPVKGGAEIVLRLAIWDTGDQALDSTVLVDGFQWITGGSVSVGTSQIGDAK